MAKASGTADISDFADISHEVWLGGGIYRATPKGNGKVIGYLRYVLPFNEFRVVRVSTTYTHPDWRGRKIATALGERLHLDFPNFQLVLGNPQAEDSAGRGFWEYQKTIQPDWETAVKDKDY